MKKLVLAVAIAAGMVVATAQAGVVRVREDGGLWKTPRAAGKTSGAPSARSGGSAAKAAVEALKDRLGISATADNLVMRLCDKDRFGRVHVRLRQQYKGVEVDGRELVVHFDASGRVYEINGEYLEGLDLDVAPTVACEGAVLAVYCATDDASAAKLAWKVRKGAKLLFVDARTGETIHARRIAHSATIEPDDLPFDEDALIEAANEMAFPAGTPTAISGNLPAQQGGAAINVGAVDAGGVKYLATKTDGSVEICVFDGFAAPQFRDSAKAAFMAGDVGWFENFYKGAQMTAYSGDDSADGDDAKNALAIVYNCNLVLDYYKSEFGRDSYDDRGGRVAAWRFWNDDMNDFDFGYANAFWTCMGGVGGKNIGCFFFGYDRTGVRSETSIDTCGHELTHGVTAWTADLEYEAESGALNESFSDLIGVACEFACQPRAADLENPNPGESDWLFDEDNGVGPERSLANPKLYEQPSRYRGANWVSTADVSEGNDYGGVHSNSGVQNFFFYLLSEGGRGNNEGLEYDLAGIGVNKAAKLAYRALSVYCVPRTNYATVRDAWDSAARDLVAAGDLTEVEYGTVAAAWAAVMGGGGDAADEGEAVYAYKTVKGADDAMSIIIKIGKPNAAGKAGVSVTIDMLDDGKSSVVKMSGKLVDGKASLSSRKAGMSLELVRSGASLIATLVESDGDRTDLYPTRVSPSIGDVAALSDLRVGVAVPADVAARLLGQVADVRYSCVKLPSGVKVDAKTGMFKGVPGKPGVGNAKLSAKCTLGSQEQKSKIKVTVMKTLPWNVAALDGWAQGRFVGENVQVKISKTGKIACKVVLDGRKKSFSAKSFAEYEDGCYRASGSIRGVGTFEFAVTERDGVQLVLMKADGSVATFYATRK